MRNFIGSLFGKSKKDNPPEEREKRVQPAGRAGGAVGAPIPGTPYKKGDFIGQDYEVFDVLGKGGFGVVYLVYSHETKSVFALKTFRDEYLEDEVTRDRFRKEAQVWVDLERHPYLVRAHVVGAISGRLYVAMEHIAKNEQGLNTLEGHLQRRPPDLAQSLCWSIQFCYGMEYAYSRGIRAHRDIKPANIMISQDKTVKITDFGLAGVLSVTRALSGLKLSVEQGRFGLSGQTLEGTGFGTPEYMPPEQFVNAAGCDQRSDVYSFGVVLYQMTSGGRLPFTAPERTFGAWYKAHVESAVPDTGSPLSSVIQRCLEKEPGRRYATFSALRAELEPLLRTQTGEVVKPPESKALEAWEWCNKGVSLSAMGRHEEAIRCHDRVLEIDPRDASAWSNKGASLAGLGRYEEAIRCQDRALEIDPRKAHAWLDRGADLGKLGRHEEAIRCYDHTLEIVPRLAPAWTNKGISLGSLGRDEEAIRCYDHALGIDPRYAAAWSCKGSCLDRLGRYGEAIPCYDRALEIDPRDVAAWHNRGYSLSCLGQHEEAVHCLDRALEINPLEARSWSGKGVSLDGLGRYEEAIRCHDRALEIDPQDATAWFNKGVSLGSLDRNEEEVRCYDRVLKIAPRHAAAWFNRALAEEGLGRKQDAVRSYRQFLALGSALDAELVEHARQRLQDLEGK